MAGSGARSSITSVTSRARLRASKRSARLNDSPGGGRDSAPRTLSIPESLCRELARLAEMGALERDLRARGFAAIAGTDEVGRGCLAGPVVAAAVILGDEAVLPRLDDSKRLGSADLQSLSCRVFATARAVAFGVVDAETIDRINILEASKLAMRHAVESLSVRPDALLVDAVYLENLIVPQLPIIQGDSRSVSIAAASIVAKVYRDSLMESYHEFYPHYDFINNVGYGTAKHCKALEEYGPSPIHRRGFRRVIDQHPLFG